MIMYFQFFQDSTERSTSPMVEKEGSLGIFQVEYDPSYQDVILDKKKPKVINISEPPAEKSEAKHSRIYKALITAETLEGFDLEGETFSDFEIGELITARCFENNPHAEKALTNKVLAVALGVLQGGEMTPAMSAKVEEATAKKAEVDAVRNLFNLGNL